MGWWLAPRRTVQPVDTLTRFDPVYWTVNFPRPMVAAVTTPAADALRVDAVFYRKGDLAGLIWESADRYDHPLLGYDTDRDYRGCRLSFRWRSHGIMPLDAVNGPTLTIEGRDASGAPRAWYVRLWNYASGTPEDAAVTIDFAALDGGFLLPGEADPVWAGDIDRLFISVIPPGFGADDTGPLDAPVEASVELTDIVCSGRDTTLAIGDVVVPEHGLRIAGGYDDSYNLTPARLMRTMLRLGYRGPIVHYVGMSHFFRLEAAGGGYYVSLAGGTLNVACAAWHRDFAARAKAVGYDVIWSLSYELLDQHCWNDWKQRSADGAAAQTGYTPPSTLLSPAHDGAMGYLRQVAQAFMAIGAEAGLPPMFQVGEPWWWLADGARPCLYDAGAVAVFAPVPIASMRGPLDAAQKATLDRAGACLAASTAALVGAVKAAAPGCITHILTYLPTLFDPATPEWRRASMPIGWARPAFDVLQLEDYDWAAAGDVTATQSGVVVATARLGYPAHEQHYLTGYVPTVDARYQWHAIDTAGDTARTRGVAQTFVWALPEVMRDGFVHFDIGRGDPVQAFDDVTFPLDLGREAEVSPGFSTSIVTSATGAEQRNAGWAMARTSYDVGVGIRGEGDIATLLAFFRARLGPARAFRLRDPFDDTGSDEALGSGDGANRRFALVRRYGDQLRRITRPVAGSVSVRVDGVAAPFALDDFGWVVLASAPSAGARVSADFTFDVPVRFAEDRLSVTRATFLAGEAPSVPLIEVREG